MCSIAIRASILFAALAVCAACGSGGQDRNVDTCHTFFAAIAGSPEQAARKAADAGDFRLLARLGVAEEVPGKIEEAVQKSLGYRIIEGTSDDVHSEECDEFQVAAWKYAVRYNAAIVDLAFSRGRLTRGQ
jgi:hypothetical protein